MATNTDGREEIKPVAPTEQTKWRDPSLVGKYMVDPKTGLAGLFRSPNNGETWILTDTVFGHVYSQDEVDNIWDNGAGHKVADEVKSATADLPNVRKQADEAVKFAESAIAASKVNSDAIVAQSSAVVEAKSAMDSATAEIQQTAANAASDAAKIRADVARVQNEVDTAKTANSASVEALKSDIDTAKQDLATVHDSLTKAQAAAEQNQKAINDSIAEINANVDATNQDLAGVRKDLTKAQSDITANQKAIDDNVAQISDDITQDRKDIADVRQGLTKAQSDITANQKAVNDNVAQINSNIEQDRKDIASAQQANADTAKQLDTYSKQATEQGKTIKTIQDKQDGFTATLADVQGNVSQVSDKVSGLSASLKDAQDNVASVKAQADQLSATLTDHSKSIAILTASAKELSSTLEDADGRLSKVEQTAQTNSSTLSDVQGDLSQVKQDATTLTATLKDAQGNISTLQQKADSVSAQLASAQGDIATLQTGVDSVKATLTSHDKSIHTLQADSKSLKDSMVNAQGDISTLRKTATDVTSELEDHTGRLSKVEQSATKQATTLSDLQGNLSQVEQKADSNTATISSINKNAMQDRGVITDTKTSFDSLTQLGTYSIKASGLPMMPEQHYGTLVVSGSAGSGWLSQQFVADTTGNVYTRVFSNNAWSAWKQGGSQDAINQVKQTADSNSATIRNVQGDVSTLKQTATGIKSTLASHEGDIHTLQADSKSLKDSMTNAQGDISTLQKSATSLDSEMKDHAGRLSKVEQNAATQATTLSDLQGNLTQVKQQADGLVTTLKDAQGDITQIQQKADGTLAQLKSAQGDIASLQTDVTGIKATLVSHEGDIHTLQSDSKTLKDDMTDVKGNISSLQKTSTSLVSEFRGHDGRLSKVEQTATEHTSELADTKGNLDKVTQKADNLQLLLSDAQKNIQNIQLDAKGLHDTLTGQSNQLASLNVTLNNLDSKYSGITGDLQSKQTALSTEQQQTKDMLLNKADKSEVDNVKGTVNQVSAEQKTMADQINQKVSSTEYQTLKDKVNGLRIGGRNLLSNSDKDIVIESKTTDPWPAWCNKTIYWDLTPGETYTFSVSATNTNNVQEASMRIWNASSNKEVGNANFVFPADSKRHSKTFTIPKDGTSYSVWLYAGHMGKIEGKNFVTTFHHPQLEMGNVESDYSPNPDDAIASIKKNSTAIDENSKLISLMAKQTEVDNIKGTAQQLSARLDVMAGEVKSKVDETKVNNIVDGKGYATQSTVQSLVDQKAGTINESITHLSAELKNNSGGGVNLLLNSGTLQFSANVTSQTNNPNSDDSLWHLSVGSLADWLKDNPNVTKLGISYDYELTGTTKASGIIRFGVNQAPAWEYMSGYNLDGKPLKGRAKMIIDVTDAMRNTHTDITRIRGDGLPIGATLKIDHPKWEIGAVTPYSQAPSDNATVTQFQSVTASIDGLQSRVTNYQNDTTSKYTQLSNMIQSKVSASDFNDLKDKTLWKSTDSIDLNSAVSQENLFVMGGSNLPPGNYWWYVQVEPGHYSRVIQYAVSDRDNIHYSRQYDGSKWSAWSQGATESEITQLRDDINLRVKSGDLLSQINLTAGNTLIQSNKLYLDASSVVITGTAFIPSAAIASLSADKVNTGWLNTNNVSLGDGRTRIRADHDYLYIQPTGSAASNTGIRMGYSGLDFLTNVIPNGYNSSVPYYSIGYDGAANGYFKISAFDHINPGGATATQNWYTMVDAISLTNSEINFATKGNMHMQVVNGGVNIKPTLFFQNNTNNGTYTGFTRLDNSNTVEFNTGDNNGENFHVNSGARFMQYVSINGYARAQGWLTNSTLSKKMNIRKLDLQTALNKIRQDDQYLYEYKRNVAQGIHDPQASFIIDDVHDVAHYSVPREFIDNTGKYREPSVELAYLIAAFQAIDKQVQKQKEEIKELKEKLQHE